MREATVKLRDSGVQALGFGDLVPLVRAAGLRDIELLEDEGRTCLPQVTVAEPLDEAALDDLECVDWWERVAERDDGYVYLLELTAAALPAAVAEEHEALLGTCEPTGTREGLELTLVGSHDAIREMLEHYEAVGARPRLRKFAEYTGTASPLGALTERQHEILETAYEMGFYEVPRESSTEEVAGELGLDPGTVSEHLQRAERNLLGAVTR